MTRIDLLSALTGAGVRLNPSAETLLASEIFDSAHAETIRPVEHTVAELGLTEGGPLSVILATAQRLGLRLCPCAAGPYLRLALLDQESAPDSVVSDGRAPWGSVTVSSALTRDDDTSPSGFYLRVIDDIPWLRGYHCTDEHIWSPHDRFMFGRGDRGSC